MSNDDRQVIFSLIGVGKVHPPKRQVLKDIYLSFFYGAKIGVLGLNGSGKSTLLRIIAGVEQDHLGEITFSKGYSVGLLEQEPQMDAEKTVKEVVEEGCARMMGLLAEYEAVSGRFAEEMSADQMDALLEQQAKLQDEIEAGKRLGAREPVGGGHGRAPLPAAGDEGRCALGGRAPARGPVPVVDPGAPTSCCWTNPPTTWMRNRCSGWSSTSSAIRARSSP